MMNEFQTQSAMETQRAEPKVMIEEVVKMAEMVEDCGNKPGNCPFASLYHLLTRYNNEGCLLMLGEQRMRPCSQEMGLIKDRTFIKRGLIYLHKQGVVFLAHNE